MNKSNSGSKKMIVILGSIILAGVLLSFVMYRNDPQAFLDSFKIIGPIMPITKIAIEMF